VSQINSPDDLFDRVCNILNTDQTNIVRTVNTAQVLSHWLIGREIIEAEQQNQSRMEKGHAVRGLLEISTKLLEIGASTTDWQYRTISPQSFLDTSSNFAQGR
jgi:hypothetical protein